MEDYSRDRAASRSFVRALTSEGGGRPSGPRPTAPSGVFVPRGGSCVAPHRPRYGQEASAGHPVADRLPAFLGWGRLSELEHTR